MTYNRELRRAADAYDRAARTPYGLIPRPTPAGRNLRTVARLLCLTGAIRGEDATLAATVFIANLLALIETVAQLRDLQHAVQSAAARTVAAHLQSAADFGRHNPGQTAMHGRRTPVTAAELAARDFPKPSHGGDAPSPPDPDESGHGLSGGNAPPRPYKPNRRPR
jgi:hypothetical protein